MLGLRLTRRRKVGRVAEPQASGGWTILFRMLKLIFTPSLLLSVPLLLSVFASGQKPMTNLGVFEGSSDIGNTNKGSTVYDAATNEYRVSGGGSDMWGAKDDFYFSWVRLSGDVTLTADIRFPSDGGAIPLKKGVLMVRQSLAPDSPYADIAIHGDGHVTPQYRMKQGGETGDTVLSRSGSTRLRIKREGDQVTTFAGAPDGKLTASAPITIVLQDPVYVGIGMCAHQDGGMETAIFANVKLEAAARK
jgi:TolB protein